MEEGFSSNDSAGGGALKCLAGLPSRGVLPSSMPSSSLGGIRVYVCDHDTSPPENQVIKTDQMNILIRALTLRKQKSEGKAPASSESSRKRTSERAADGRASAKRAMTNSQNGSSRDGSKVDRDYQGLTVERLRAVLKEKGLSVKGKKDELIARLRSAK